MSMADRVTYLQDNPTIKQIITPVAFVSGTALSGPKVDGGFKDVLNRIGDANPHTPLGHEYGSKGIKETKTREAVNKQKKRQG